MLLWLGFSGGGSMTMTIPADQHFLSLSDLLSSGFSYYKINKLVSEGRLIKLNNRMYENTAYCGETSDFETVSVYAPKGGHMYDDSGAELWPDNLPSGCGRHRHREKYEGLNAGGLAKR